MDKINFIPQPIDKLPLEELNTILGKYKAGKTRLDMRVKSAENWWKMGNLFEEHIFSTLKNFCYCNVHIIPEMLLNRVAADELRCCYCLEV